MLYEATYKNKISLYGMSNNQDLMNLQDKLSVEDREILVLDKKAVRWLKKHMKDAQKEHEIILLEIK